VKPIGQDDPVKNIQITVDEETLRQVDRVSGPIGLKRLEVVRQALRQWLQRRATEYAKAYDEMYRGGG
jgi:metal-responsive CopG/Arc/MetJ family transcriptional regulator